MRPPGKTRNSTTSYSPHIVHATYVYIYMFNVYIKSLLHTCYIPGFLAIGSDYIAQKRIPVSERDDKQGLGGVLVASALQASEREMM